MPAKSNKELLKGLASKDPRAIGKAISMVENNGDGATEILAGLLASTNRPGTNRPTCSCKTTDRGTLKR
jgi:putative protein kinase ArgK-like GTPase of G3E family